MCFEMAHNAHNTRLRKRRVLGVLTFGTLHYDSRTAEAKPSDSKPYKAITTLDLMGIGATSLETYRVLVADARVINTTLLITYHRLERV